MIRIGLILALICGSAPVFADTVVAKRTIRAQEVIGLEDVTVIKSDTPGAAQAIEQVAGFEARKIIYAGRPISMQDLGAPALVERNALVKLGFKANGLVIMTEGRALSRGSFGERIRVMNLESKTSVSGTIGGDGIVWVNE